ncbi:cytochrome P450 [Psychromarinibacter sp. C21-152]|uniref:Cytochrome P450 n=1 Tax=Psychromarinibacter sediminicola TaxID=3033385 RepID=A0AAE3T824_9RHOB|nr:cytochrome P450 [Psychromarinibacter sediminicola]MDF0600802.1 cytochrome P450 [Psychromarinibacter sediminicola]
MPQAPFDDTITYNQLVNDPYAVYRRLRAETPVVRVKAVGRTMITKAADTRAIKDDAALWSSDDPNTPMERAFHAHTLMRKDGEEHKRERMAMAPTFSPKNLKTIWGPAYEKLANEYLDRLPRDEVVDLFPTLAGPLAARILAVILGIPGASDDQMQHWSQALIDGAGNFGWDREPFERVDHAHVAMNAEIERMIPKLKAEPDETALSVMINAEDPLRISQIFGNIKIAIGGGINEPRDALLTILYGLLTNPEQLEEVKRTGAWGDAFEEGVRWVAPIQVSSRRATEDAVVGGCDIPKGDVVMTIQASANHDEDIWDAPEKYDALRKRSPHQSFGSGPHHCLGTHLARMMLGKIMLPLIFERFPNIELVAPETVVWKGFGFRGPLNLPVRLN